MTSESKEKIIKRAIFLAILEDRDTLRLSDFVLLFCYKASEQLKISTPISFYEQIHEFLKTRNDLARLEVRSMVHYVYLNEKEIKAARDIMNGQCSSGKCD